MTFGPKFTDLHSSPKERQLQTSCVSFGEECIVAKARFSVTHKNVCLLGNMGTIMYTIPCVNWHLVHHQLICAPFFLTKNPLPINIMESMDV